MCARQEASDSESGFTTDLIGSSSPSCVRLKNMLELLCVSSFTGDATCADVLVASFGWLGVADIRLIKMKFRENFFNLLKHMNNFEERLYY